MTVRKTIFWLHLAAGLIVGLVVAVMSVTGITLAFEREILAFIDRDLRQLAPLPNTPRLTIEQLDHAVQAQYPDFKTTTRTIPRESNAAYEFRAGRERLLYVNPYTGMASEPKSQAAHDLLHIFEGWHRWLGMEGEDRAVGKLITGIANLAFLFLCITGLYMWWPRSWTPRALKPALLLVKGIKGRARDFNWHNVFGSWSALVLIVIVTGGVVISFQWANRLVFHLAGEEPPVRGQSPTPTIFLAADNRRMPLSVDALLQRVTREYPNWQSMAFETPSVPQEPNKIAALNVTVVEPALFEARGRTQLALDPYTGEILRKISFADRSPAQQARTWLRFLHTGEAFGVIGKMVATIATMASLFLVYTGFALSYRRFFPRKISALAPSVTSTAER